MHLDRSHRSSLPDILSRVTAMPVREAAEGVKLEVNHVYIGPGDASLLVGDGVLHLAARPPRGMYMPIDHLFRSLAAVQKSRAIGVLLSGEGTDGALGFQAIKAEGGITFAQDEQSARHDSMPRSAVVEGTVDYVLPPEEIGRRAGPHRPARLLDRGRPHGLEAGEAIDQVIGLVRSHTDVDFTHYKRTTIQRRIQRRMALRNVESVEDYLRPPADGPDRAARRCTTTSSSASPSSSATRNLSRRSKTKVFPALAGEPRGERAHPPLGGRLRHRRGGLLAGHLPAGVPRQPRNDPIRRSRSWPPT